MLWKCSFQDQCRALLSSTSPGKLCLAISLTRNLYQNVTASNSPGNKSRAEARDSSQMLVVVSLLLFLAHGDSLGILSSSNCWRTTRKDILLTSIYSTSGGRGRLSQNRQNTVLPLAENSHTGSKLQLSSAQRMGRQHRRNVKLQL